MNVREGGQVAKQGSCGLNPSYRASRGFATAGKSAEGD